MYFSIKNNIKKIKGIALILLVSVFFTVALPIASPDAYAQDFTDDAKNLWPDPPDIVSGAAILMDADTGAILYEKNAHERNYPASTTKIVTGLLVARYAALDETITFSEAAADSVEYGDATLAAKAGEQMSVEQALHGLLLYSANEIAYGLAEHVAGSVEGFADLMNKAADEAGALDTHFVNASGLFDSEHYSTAYDMAMIARTCFDNPAFLAIDSKTTYEIPPTNMTPESRIFNNRNLLLPGRTYNYEYCVGGKTGYLPEGGNTYVAYAQKDDMKLIAVCFRSTAEDRFTDAKTMFEWGFNNFDRVSLSGTDFAYNYSGSSYLSSQRFDTGRIQRKFDVSYITLPQDASLSDLTVTADDIRPVALSDTVADFPVLISLSGHNAGTTDMIFHSTKNEQTHSSLPAPSKESDNDSSKSAIIHNNAFVIDLRILIAIGLAILALIIGLSIRSAVNSRRQNAYYKSYRERR